MQPVGVYTNHLHSLFYCKVGFIFLQSTFDLPSISVFRQVVFRPTFITHVHSSVYTLIKVFCEKDINLFLLEYIYHIYLIKLCKKCRGSNFKFHFKVYAFELLSSACFFAVCVGMVGWGRGEQRGLILCICNFLLGFLLAKILYFYC